MLFWLMLLIDFLQLEFFVTMLAIIVQCVICVINCRILKNSPSIILRRQFKHFNEQAFLRDVYESDLCTVSLIPDVNLAWEYFKCAHMLLLKWLG